jgi:Competence protein CoiA-like family
MNESTTLVALRTDTGQRVSIGDTPEDSLRLLSDGRLLRCPHCGTPLLLKAGPVRVHHFAHVNLSACAGSEPETESHRAGKLRLFEHFRPGALVAAMEYALTESGQRADVYVQSRDAHYALEFQQANNSAEQWAERHARYRQAGLADVWILGQARYQPAHGELVRSISPYDPRPVPRDMFSASAGAFKVREMEREMLAALAQEPDALPILYYLDPDSGDMTALLAREVRNNTLRAYRYVVPLGSCALRAGRLWTPLDPLLVDYRASREGS